MRNDVLPGIGVRYVTKWIEINDVETFDLRAARRFGGLGEGRTRQSAIVDLYLPDDGIVSLMKLIGTDSTDTIGTSGNLARGVLTQLLVIIRGGLSGFTYLPSKSKR